MNEWPIIHILVVSRERHFLVSMQSATVHLWLYVDTDLSYSYVLSVLPTYVAVKLHGHRISLEFSLRMRITKQKVLSDSTISYNFIIEIINIKLIFTRIISYNFMIEIIDIKLNLY